MITESVNKWEPKDIGNPVSGAQYVVEYLDNDGKTKFDKYHGQACYISLSNRYSDNYYGADRSLKKYKTAVAIHAAIIGGQMKDKMDDYLSFLFDPKRSPWASIIPRKGLDWVPPTQKQPIVTIPVTSETPSQLVFNLLFAVRLGHDIPQIVRRFNWLTERGWTEYEALFTSVYYGLDRNNKTVTEDPWNNHNAFNSGRLIDLTALEKKQPHLTKPNLKFYNGYSNVTDIWDKPGRVRYSTEIYNIKKVDTNYEGAFKKTFNNKVGHTFYSSNEVDNDTILALKDEILAKGRS